MSLAAIASLFVFIAIVAVVAISGVVFKLARGDRTAGKEYREATPEEPEEY